MSMGSGSRRYFPGIVNRVPQGDADELRRGVRRLDIAISEQGLRQALNGEMIASEVDRRALADLLHLIANKGTVGVLIGLLLPAVQQIREPARRQQ